MLFYFIFHGNLIILIILAVMLVIILALIAMIMTITSGWIFNLCFRLFVDRKLTTYFFYLIIVSIFTIYILFLFDLNWIIKWTNLNTVNLIIQISEFSCFLMMMINLCWLFRLKLLNRQIYIDFKFIYFIENLHLTWILHRFIILAKFIL